MLPPIVPPGASPGAAPDPVAPGSGTAPRAAAAGSEAMLNFWTTWMEAVTGQSQAAILDPAGSLFEGSVRRLGEHLARDPFLRSVDSMWSANPLREVVPVDWAEIARALRTVWLRSMENPAASASAAAELNTRLWRTAMDNWTEAGRRWIGAAEAASPSPAGGGPRQPEDKRFAAPEWQGNPFYRTLKDAYLLASEWLMRQAELPGLEENERQRLTFHLRQFVDAMSPSLLLISNPTALRRAMETGGASLADGARNLLNDLRAGKLSMVDSDAFAPGRNLALTPGKVVYRNRLIELIQYEPAGESVHAVPLLILPPWINKFYILDMQPRNSMVNWLREQGFTVFMVSWKNPDASMDDVGIEDYMRLGPLAASDVVRDITGSPRINVMGYCIAGTLLSMTLAWLAAKDDDRFQSATFMVTLQDFSKVGDTAIFMGEDTLDLIERQMMERGYLDSREISNMFNLLRSNDLIWANVVNNYLMGQKPPAFDLLHWNSDSTRMARTAHSWYLRNTYVENNLVVPGRIELAGERIDLGRIRQDVYVVGAEKDHIVPWDAAWKLTRLVGGQSRYVLASSGHIAGVINPPGGKGNYWLRDPALPPTATAGEWRREAVRRDGSWWTDWGAWLAERSGPRVRPPPMGGRDHPPLGDAPGTYVMER